MILGSLSFTWATAQLQILGGASHPEIEVYSSENWQPFNRKDSCPAVVAFNGDGLIGAQCEASRFLYQATLGSTYEEIRSLAGADFGKWIDRQMALPYRTVLEETREVLKEVIDWHYLTGGDSIDAPNYANWLQIQYAWWNQHMLHNDRLRQRVAFALSEIFVVSIESDLQGYGEGVASYYDLFKRNAFGNYRDLLRDVALHPAMGYYLSHLNNPKTDTVENTHPDENFAREIMQLFSIGLYELKPDGSHKLDSAGRSIASYNQRDIKELAKVFTGLGISKVVPNMYLDTAIFGMGIYFADMTVPMRMYERWHEPGAKTLVNGAFIPEGLSGMEDIELALDALFHHPNTGPFICKQLIQRMIKSNPSQEYVGRVAAVFADDGFGVRGNLGAVIRALLLDPEARTCEALQDPANGQLREPLLRYTHFCRALDVEQYYGRFWNTGYDFWLSTGQLPLASPSVFNFFSPFFHPRGPLDQLGLVGPEFQIHNARTSIGYLNLVDNWAIDNYVMSSWEPDDPYTILNISELEALAQDAEVLINHLDMVLTHGQLSDRTRSIVRTAIEKFINGNYRRERVRMAIYLVMISPDYAIFK